jgi:hypothetical protein
MDELSDSEFTRMFRMSRISFYKLLDLITSKISVDTQKAINSSGSAICAKARLAATIRWLAGGSYLDICLCYGLDPSNFFNRNYVLWKTMHALDSEIKLGFSLDPTVLSATARGFSKASGGQLLHCVSAIDGWVCKTRCPTKKEAGLAVKSYRNRKNCWGIVVLAGCHAQCRFNMVSAQWSGSTHDCLAWEACNIKRGIDRGLLPTPYYVIGDEAFVNEDQVLVPWSGRGLGPWKDSFNYHLSSARQCIERAFGMLTQRWGVFWRPLKVGLERWGLVVTVAAKLHNYCVDEKEELVSQHKSNMAQGDVCEVITSDAGQNDEDDIDVFKLHTSSGGHGKRGTRLTITTMLQCTGKLRPTHALHNSRANK